ncbi:MAG: glycosyltransferase [Lentisphaerae bacterium]|nr:glycosyltransferase [Lentisphaerota bacterium]
MQPVTLHIGAPKTGSTFLQRWLEENSALLAARGLHTLPLMLCHRLAVECIRDPQRLAREDAAHLLAPSLDPAAEALREGVTDGSLFRTVLSSEYFTDADPAAVVALLCEHGLVVDKILCFVRRQDRAFASGVNQSIKVAGRSQLPGRLRYRRGLDWHALYKRWQSGFPEAELVFRNYDKHTREQTLLTVFKEEIGFVGDGVPDRLPQVAQSNPSLNTTLLEICRLANERGHTELGSFLVKAQLDGLDGPRYELSQEQATCLEEIYVESNKALADALGSHELTELGQPGWESQGTGLSGEASAEALVDLLAHTVSRLPAAEIRPAHGIRRQKDRAEPCGAAVLEPAPSPAPTPVPAPSPLVPSPPGGWRLNLRPRALAHRGIALLLRPVFDTNYYLDTYPDVAKAGVNPWRHYLENGSKEGRMRKPGRLVFSGNARLFSATRKTILVVLHEGSRTGAPIIGYNLVLGLVKKYNVVVLSLAPGPVAEACSLAGAYVAAPRRRTLSWWSGDLFVRQLARSFSFTFAIVNAFGARFTLRQLARLKIPVVSLIHEFAGNIHPLSDFVKTVEWSAVTVFPSHVTRDNAQQLLPALRGKEFPIIPQGRCLLPARIHGEDLVDRVESVEMVRTALGLDALAAGTIVVMGVGYVSYRKGVDLFLQVASRFIHDCPDMAVHFVWVGDAYNPKSDGNYSAYLADQIQREALEGRVHFAGEILNMDAAYGQADILLLSSRLDPLPNVCIEAMSAGLPFICFDNASGFSDILKRYGVGPECVARYLDIADMTKKLGALALAPERRQAMRSTGLRIVDEMFSMPVYVDRIEALALATVANSRTGDGPSKGMQADDRTRDRPDG